MFKAGDITVYREGEGASGGGGGGQQPAIPWAGSDNGPWSIGDKPWYEVAITGDDDVANGTREFLKTKNYRDPSVVARSLYELQRQHEHLKGSALTLPGENATPEEWNTYYKKIGRPDNAEGYKDVKWGDNADPKMVEFAKTLAYDLGISPKMAEGVLAKRWNEFAAEQNRVAEEAGARANEEAINALKGEWGAEYDQNLAQGRRVMEALRGKGISEDDFAAVEKAIGIAPLVKMLGTLGKLTGETGFMTGGGASAEIDGMTPEAAKAKYEQNMADEAFKAKYFDANHPEHDNALAVMEALAKKAGNLM